MNNYSLIIAIVLFLLFIITLLIGSIKKIGCLLKIATILGIIYCVYSLLMYLFDINLYFNMEYII